MPFDHNTNRWRFDKRPTRPVTEPRPIVALGWTQQQWDKVFAWYEEVMDVRVIYRDSASVRQAVNMEWQRRKGSLQP